MIRDSKGFIDWTLVVVFLIVLACIGGGIFAYIAYEKRLGEEKANQPKPPPSSIKPYSYSPGEEDPGMAGEKDSQSR